MQKFQFHPFSFYHSKSLPFGNFRTLFIIFYYYTPKPRKKKKKKNPNKQNNKKKKIESFSSFDSHQPKFHAFIHCFPLPLQQSGQ